MAKPIVDGIERDLNGKAEVIRLNATSQLGRQAAGYFGVRGVPTLIVVNGEGDIALTQVGLIRAGDVKETVHQLLSP